MRKFFHGTAVKLSLGSMILPPSRTGIISEAGRLVNRDRVFFTADLGSARIYAGRARRSLGLEIAYIYEVAPAGEVICMNASPGTSVYHASRARVIRIVEVKR